VGALLALNCAFILIHMARVIARVRAQLKSDGMDPGSFVGPAGVPLLHVTGLALGLGMLAWGLSG